MTLSRTHKWLACGHTFTTIDASFDEIQLICSSAGFHGFEGAPLLFEGKTDAQLKEISQELKNGGVHIPSLHLPHTAEEDITAFYETNRRKAVSTIERWLEKAVILGSSVCILHPSTNGYEVAAEGLDEFIRQFGKSMRTLLSVAEQLNIHISVENMLPGKGSRFGSQIEHFRRIHTEIDHPNLGFCLDTGHAAVSVGTDHVHDFFSVMASQLTAIHLNDTSGDRDLHIAPGHGFVRWDLVLQGIDSLSTEPALCIETPPFAQGPIYEISAWKELVQRTDSLVEKARNLAHRDPRVG